jgi:Ca2+-binding EF-hand superfamily protein
MLQSVKKNDAFWNQIKDAYVDPMVFINKSGNVVDLRFPGRAVEKSLTSLANNVQVPYVNLRPFKYIADMFGLMNKARFQVAERFLAGSVMPTIENSLDVLKKDYLYFNGRYIDQAGQLVKDNQFLAYAKFGAWQRATTAMSGATLNPKANDIPTTAFGKARKYLGLGYQDFESSIGRKASAITKFDNQKWARNIYDTMTNPASMASVSEDNLNEAFRVFYSTVDNNTAKLDTDTLRLAMPYMSGAISKDTADNILRGSQKDGLCRQSMNCCRPIRRSSQ